MHPYTFLFFAGVVVLFIVSAGIVWVVEELWWLLLAVAIIVLVVCARKGLAIDKRLKKVQATEIIAVNGIQTEVYAHKGYSVGMFGRRTHYYERTMKETGRIITFRLHNKDGTFSYETAKEGTYLCNSLKRLLDGPRWLYKPGMQRVPEKARTERKLDTTPDTTPDTTSDTTPIFRDHEEW